jgi:asparagine synthase (glutamine-hydrolysing)
VILDGQGGDELFAGYLPYYPLRIRDLLAGKSPAAHLEAYYLIAMVARHWGWQWLAGVDSASLLNRARALAARLRRQAAPSGSAGVEPPFFHASLSERVAGREIVRHQPTKYPDSLSQTLFRHLVDQSIPALLHYEDRNSMAFSLEARVPLLDYRIVEFALGLPAGYKIRGSWTKWILRKAAESRLPAKVAWRRSKMGYPTPAARWMRQPKERDALHDLLYSKRFLDREIVSRDSLDYYWQQHQSGKVDRSWLLYRYATTELWYRHYIDAFVPKTARPGPVLELKLREAAE